LAGVKAVVMLAKAMVVAMKRMIKEWVLDIRYQEISKE
jgi:hypothetical protein